MKVVVLGAGGHARSVIDALTASAEHEVVAITDPRPELAGTEFEGAPVVGDDSKLGELRADGVEGACLGIGGTGDNGPRMRAFELAHQLGFGLPVIVHPAAVISATATLGKGTVVLARAVVGPGARVGSDVIVNTGAIVEHDCVIGDHTHIASGAVLGGAVEVGESAHVGLAASILQGVSIGASAVVGAGAVVIRDVAAGDVAAGVPAASLRGH